MKKYFIVVFLLMSHIVVSQTRTLKEDVVKYLIVHKQLNVEQDEKINYKNSIRVQFIPICK